MSDFEVYVLLAAEDGELDADLFAKSNELGIESMLLPDERSGLPFDLGDIDGTIVIISGAATGIVRLVSWLGYRLRRGVVVDTRKQPVTVRSDPALPRGYMLIVDSEGSTQVKNTVASSGRIAQALSAPSHPDS